MTDLDASRREMAERKKRIELSASQGASGGASAQTLPVRLRMAGENQNYSTTSSRPRFEYPPSSSTSDHFVLSAGAESRTRQQATSLNYYTTSETERGEKPSLWQRLTEEGRAYFALSVATVTSGLIALGVGAATNNGVVAVVAVVVTVIGLVPGASAVGISSEESTSLFASGPLIEPIIMFLDEPALLFK